MGNMKNQLGNAAVWMVMFVVFVLAWFTHLYVCFSEEKWGFLVAGAVMFPIAIVHGIGIWLGIW